MNSGDVALLTIDNVSKTYGDVSALHGVSLSIERGEFVSIIGPSGSGKSTLLKILAGTEDATSGTVLYEGKDIREIDRRRQDMVMVWQSLALFPHMTVEKNIGFGLRVRGLSGMEESKRVADAMLMVGLDGKGKRQIRELSGGEQQRVALARALIVSPKILLLDEPMGALDAHLRSQLQAQLRQLHRSSGITFIMVTHDQAEALALSHTIAVLNNGRVEQVGSPTTVMRQPMTPFVAGFVGNRNILRGRISDVCGDTIRVTTRVGDLAAVKPKWLHTTFSAGMPVVYVIDASRIKSNASSRNRVGGSIESQNVVGSLETIRVKTKDGETLSFETYGNSQSATDRMSESIELSWAAEDAYVLLNEEQISPT